MKTVEGYQATRRLEETLNQTMAIKYHKKVGQQ